MKTAEIKARIDDPIAKPAPLPNWHPDVLQTLDAKTIKVNISATEPRSNKPETVFMTTFERAMH